MAVRLVSDFQPDPSDHTSTPDPLAAMTERLTVIERSLVALTTELDRMIDEVSYMRMKFEQNEGNHR